MFQSQVLQPETPKAQPAVGFLEGRQGGLLAGSSWGHQAGCVGGDGGGDKKLEARGQVRVQGDDG